MSAAVFRVRSADLAGRLDPFYYLPRFAELERAIAPRSARTLGKIVRAMSSGATPHLSRREELYDDAENGVPLLRVQNVTEDGVNERDLVFIRREVHETDLRRSRVSGGDLLVTITGRVGSAAVAPDGFEGNINQHSVVVKTESRQTSEYLAAFLNSRVGRALTLRRAAGGTRPALDYSALRSVPIAEGLPIVEVMQKARAKKAAKESEAVRILGEADDYLLGELGIKTPPKEDGASRVFIRRMREMSGGRLDAEYHQSRFVEMARAVENCAHRTRAVGECVLRVLKGCEVGSKNYAEEGIPYVRVSDLDEWGMHPESCGEHVSADLFAELRGDFMPRAGEMVYTKDATIGCAAVVEEEADCIVSGGVLRITPAKDVDVRYLAAVLSSPPMLALANRESTGGVLRHLLVENFLRLRIPVPHLRKQREIAGRIGKIRARAKRLRTDADAVMEAARDEVERIILGN